jgi:hypothetical protein
VSAYTCEIQSQRDRQAARDVTTDCLTPTATDEAVCLDLSHSEGLIHRCENRLLHSAYASVGRLMSDQETCCEIEIESHTQRM